MTKRDDNDNYITLTMRISRGLRNRIAEAAKKENKTTTTWLCELAEDKMNEKEGISEVKTGIYDKLDILSTKLDTITNIVSKL